MDKINYAFLGSTNYSKDLLIFLIKLGYIPKVIFSIPKKFKISYSEKKIKNINYANLEEIAIKYNIKYLEIDSSKGKQIKDYEDILKNMNLDFLLVLGWYYMLPRKIRDLAMHGAWGIHASLLPRYAGGAPLTWAIINGEEKTGVTLFKLGDGVDDGDIILQKEFIINYKDTIKEVYEKATIKSKEILLEVFRNMNNIVYKPQDKKKIEVYPQRNRDDGEIDLSMNAMDLYNFIRAQSAPYPGAFIKTVDGKRLVIERVRIED